MSVDNTDTEWVLGGVYEVSPRANPDDKQLWLVEHIRPDGMAECRMLEPFKSAVSTQKHKPDNWKYVCDERSRKENVDQVRKRDSS